MLSCKNVPQTCLRDFFPIIQMLTNMVKFLGTSRLAKHLPWLRNVLIIIKMPYCFNKGQNLKHPRDSSANIDSNSKETEEDKKKEKGAENPKKKAQWQANCVSP